jgi:hypothetical protein
LLVTLALGVGLLLATSSSVGAYGGGPANWQIGFAGTIVVPGLGNSGFWGWCQLSNAFDSSNPMAGTSGDCQVANYFHLPSGGVSLECHVSVDVTSWGPAPGIGLAFGVPADLYVFSGTQTATGQDPAACGGNGATTPADVAPAQAGHYNANSLVPFVMPGAVGEIQIQVTQIP